MTAITHEYNVYDKKGFIDTLNKIIKRYKVTTEVVWGEPIHHQMAFDGDNYIFEVFSEGANTFTITSYPVTVTFDFDEFKIEGYTYLGCIKDEMMMGLITIHGNELLNGVDVNEFVKSFESIPCHHCERKHKRTIGHLFLHNETKEYQVFGSSCAKKYFGINFDKLLKFFERLNTSFGEGWDNSFIRGWRDKTINWKFVAQIAYYIISKQGYVSVTKSKESDMCPTSDYVRHLYIGNRNSLNTEDKKIIKDIRDTEFPDMDILFTTNYAKNPDNLTDFEHNISILQEKMKKDMVDFTNYGLLTFMVFNEFFNSKEPKDSVEYIIPEWAVAKKRIKNDSMGLDVVLSNKHTFMGFYGVTNIYTFILNGNIRLKWFTSIDLGLNDGDSMSFKAFTVKDTEDNKYGKSVIITRATLVKDKPKKSKEVSKDDKTYLDRLGL